jgi:hypothetical protein
MIDQNTPKNQHFILYAWDADPGLAINTRPLTPVD